MIINPVKELVVTVRSTVGMKGFFKFKTIDKFSGKSRIDTDWMPNTILNDGRNVMATRSDWMNCCQVGTNGTFPVLLADRQAETSLGNFFAGTSTIQTTTSGQAGSAPYYGWKRKTWRFPEGSVAANLQEAAVGWSTAGGSTIITRAAILDPILQTPTTITPLIDELLDVTYELRYYPPLIDVTSPQITLYGVTYDTITRAASVTGDRWSADIGEAIGQYSGLTTDWLAYDGNIGAITSTPSGSTAACSNATQYNSGYSSNSYQIQMNSSCGSTGWNLGGGIRSIRFRTTAGDYQTQFNAVGTSNTIPKTALLNMQMAWIISWTEKV